MNKIIKSTKDIADLFMDELRYEKQEILKVIMLNSSNELNNIIEGVKWLIIIDWRTIPEIRFYCDVSQGDYKSYKLFSEEEKDKAQQRKNLMITINEKLQDLNKMNMKCQVKDNTLGIIKKDVSELSQITNAVEEILKIVEDVADEINK